MASPVQRLVRFATVEHLMATPTTLAGPHSAHAARFIGNHLPLIQQTPGLRDLQRVPKEIQAERFRQI